MLHVAILHYVYYTCSYDENNKVVIARLLRVRYLIFFCCVYTSWRTGSFMRSSLLTKWDFFNETSHSEAMHLSATSHHDNKHVFH